jgi:hypothetical protein
MRLSLAVVGRGWGLVDFGRFRSTEINQTRPTTAIFFVRTGILIRFKRFAGFCGDNLHVCLMFAAAESCESLNSENPDSDKSGNLNCSRPKKKRPSRSRLTLTFAENLNSKEMEEVLKKQLYTDERYPGVQFDENGDPVGKSIVEILDKLDRDFVKRFGEEGRRMANTRRERWNKDGLWHFDLF